MPSRAHLGKRHTCFKCACKFYDLNRAEPLCPRCGADQREDPTPDPRVAVMERYKPSRNAPTPKDRLLDPDEDVDFDDFDGDADDDDDDDPPFDDEGELDEEDED